MPARWGSPPGGHASRRIPSSVKQFRRGRGYRAFREEGDYSFMSSSLTMSWMVEPTLTTPPHHLYGCACEISGDIISRAPVLALAIAGPREPPSHRPST
jgi:hypothetical protein